MARLRLAVAEAAEESVTSIVKVKLPGVVGVPESRPLLAKLSPAGSPPVGALHSYPVPVPPVAVRVAEYEALTVPPGREVAATVNAVGPVEAEDPPPPQPCSRERVATTQ